MNSGLSAPQGAPTSEASFIEAFDRECAELEEHRKLFSTPAAKLGLLVISAGLAAASFSTQLSWRSVAALLLVLLVHELGHLLAMRWAGFRDLKVFFLPFVGAAASGRHDRPSLNAEIAVLLAGPLPGLALGLIGLAWLDPAQIWLRQAALIAVVINALNLLPLHPLDGGKVAEILLLGRWPRLAVGVRLVGIVVVLGFSVVSSNGLASGVWLGLGLLMLVAMPTQWRVAQVATSLHRQGLVDGLTRPQALRAAFAALTDQGYSELSGPQQRGMVTALLPQLMRAPSSALARSLWILAFVALLAGGLGAARQSFSRAAPAPGLDAQMQRQLVHTRQALESEPQSPSRWTTLQHGLEAVAPHMLKLPSHQTLEAERLLQQAEQWAPQQLDALAATTQAVRWRAMATRDADQRVALLEGAMQAHEAPGALRADVQPLFLVTLEWLKQASVGDASRRLARVDRSLALGAGRPFGAAALALQSARLDLLLELGREGDALAQCSHLYRYVPTVDTALLWIDAAWALQGADSALRLVEWLLADLQARNASPAQLAVVLRRGMWLAESLSKPEWQRVRAPWLEAVRKPPPPLLARTLDGLFGVQTPRADELAELELAHWRGDTDAARQLADRLRARDQAVALGKAKPAPASLQARVGPLLQGERERLYKAYALQDLVE